MKTMKFENLIIQVAVFFVGLLIQVADAGWVAYNDCIRQPGDSTAANVTDWTIYGGYTDNTTGMLLDFATGSDVGMPTVTFTMNSAAPVQTHIDYGDNFAAGTPAHTIFDQKVDFSGTILQHSSSTGWWVEIEFTGLDPTRKYTFVGTAVRISPSDLDRISLLTIKDAVSYVNNSGYHSIGDSSWVGTDTTKFLAVGNATEGVVVRWDDIEPGADGDFAVRAEADSSVGSHGRRAYPLAGFMLEELGPAGNNPPEVDAGADQETTLPDNTVSLNGTVDDDGLGEPNGFLALMWSKASGPGEVTFEPNEFVEDPNVIFEPLAHGTYVLQLEATDGELSASDVVTVTVNESICPPGDLTVDCIVNWADVEILAGQWLLPNGSANLNGKNGVEMDDFAWLARDWQENRQRGSLQVTIEPQGAVDAGAQWRVDGGTWRDSGYIEGDLTVGLHTIEFSAITGWGEPSNKQVHVDYAQTMSTSGTYIQQTGSLQVMIYPQTAVDAGAKWRVDAGSWRSSGETLSGLSVGSHTVDYSSVNGWIKPPTQQVQIFQALPTITSGTYQQLGDTPVVINEFMAVNSYVPFINPTFNMYTEVYGFDVHPDWIELHNMDPINTVDLEGWYLTNDPEDLTKWCFPSGEYIGPNGYYVLFASGKKQEDNPGNYPFRDGDGSLHTNFVLGSGGEYLALVEPNGVTISHEYAPEYPEQRGFVSYGIGSGGYGYLVTPTPGSRVTGRWSGAANSAKYDGAVEDTEFDHDRGFYYAAFNVVISCATPGATIRYTLDGSEPTMTNGWTYSTPILIDTTTCLRAAAFKSNWLPSNVDTQTYIFPAHVIVQTNAQAIAAGYPSYWGRGGDYEMDPEIYNDPAYSGVIEEALSSIPTLSVAMDKDHLFGSLGIYTNPSQIGILWERPTSAELFDANGVTKFQVNCGIRIQGGASRNIDKAPKHSLSLRFRGGYGPGELECELFDGSPVDRFNSLQIRAMFNNSWIHWDSGQRSRGSMIRDQWMRDSLLEMGDPGGGYGTYVHLYLNGLYWGVFNVHERPDAEHYASHYGGNDDQLDALNSGSPVDGTATSWNNLHTLVANAVTGGISLSEYQQIQQKLDFVNLIDYMIVNHYGENSDWDGHNWRAAGGGIADMPWRIFNWDAERVLESVSENRTGQNSAGDPSRLFHNMTNSDEFKMLIADRMHKHLFNNGALMAENTAARWMRRADELDLAIICESARWGDYRRDVHQYSNGPYLLYTKNDHWLVEQNRLMNDYFPYRSKNPLNSGNLLNQYKSRGWYPSVEAPVFNPHGGWNFTGFNVTIINPNGYGAIWYTTNGEDPRLPGGAVNLVHATTYSVPLNLSRSTNLKARVLDGTTWSALNEAVYGVGPVAEDLRVTEIMYHPKNTGDPSDPNTEFIELKNIGTNTLNLNLVKFTEGIHFTFPDTALDPGECVVVVRDESAFESKYGISVNSAGQYVGSLDNNGERIKLEDAIGRTILDFEYKDGWHSITDGDGFSLTIIDPRDSITYGSDQSLTAYWKFDDGAGNTATDSAGTNDGTLNGNPAWTTGRFDGALSFDGDGDYVSFASNDALASESVTVQAWIRVSEFAGMYNPIMIQHLGRNGYHFYVTSFQPIFFMFGGVASTQAMSPEAIETDQWYHVAGTNDGTQIKLYVDGHLKATAPSTGFLGFDNAAYIGCEPIYLYYYTGLIDDVRVHNRPLGEHEFQAIADPTLRWNWKDSWRASVYRNGTPGWDDSGILPNPGAVVINELMAHSNAGPDWIELYNTTDEPINISGWFLSDNDRDEPNLMKYRIADGTIIDVNDYKVFYQDTDFNNLSNPGCLVPFALSENGEKVCLSSLLDPNGMLTGYREIEDFGASATNVSFGRYFKSSTGNYNFVAMDYNTPDSNNAYPKVGPVVINEIMYNPPTGNQREEYIELHNITGSPVTLYRIDKFSPWRFTDGIDYTCPNSPPVTIPGDGYLMVVKDETSFTARYGSMPGDVQILEGYNGWLSNGGERLQIGMPGDIDEFGTRYYIRIDRVRYSDGSHPEDVPGGVDLWPAEADGLGKSLSRKVPTDYGNDVANWRAANPSPGTANP